MDRVVVPELLDELPVSDSRAKEARLDLQRLNWLMGHARLVEQAFQNLGNNWGKTSPLRVVELGAGDGTLLLSLARKLSKKGIKGQATLVDRKNLVSEQTRKDFSNLDWTVEVDVADVFDWLERPSPQVHLILCNLFLHHFSEEALRRLLERVAVQSESFIGCEPERSRLGLIAARLLWFIGCNSVSRNDAWISVRAGFANQELTGLWPQQKDWGLIERSCGMFSHCFFARRHA